MLHSNCRYYYIGPYCTTVQVYESLLEKYIDKEIVKKKPCCGLNPIAIILDENQPICREFENDKTEEVKDAHAKAALEDI